MVNKAAHLFDAGQPCGAEANMSKYLAAEASWKAGDVCVQASGTLELARVADNADQWLARIGSFDLIPQASRMLRLLRRVQQAVARIP